MEEIIKDLRNLYTKLGFSEEESGTALTGIMSIVILETINQALSVLGSEQRPAIEKSLVEAFERDDDPLTVLSDCVPEDTLAEILTQSVQVAVERYYDEISPSLTEEQKDIFTEHFKIATKLG